MTHSPILVAGGTRGTGLLVVELLESRGFRVRVLARDPIRAKADLSAAVEIVAGDITKADTLPAAVKGVSHIIFTAGIRSGRYAREEIVKATDYQGVLNTVDAARATGFSGRFVYMNSLGITTSSIPAILLNALKKNTLVWRRRAEEGIRASGVDYAIVRVGFLLNSQAGQHAVRVTQDSLPLAIRNRIARADVSEALVEAVHHPAASRATFDVVWGKGRHRESWKTLFAELKPDRP
jgi:uncharacterized protein YbjT (DUF2867 family)